jgi:hypothetical protein
MPPSSDLSCRAIANYVEAQKVTKARSICGSTGITVREDLPRPLFFGGLGKTMNRLLKTGLSNALRSMWEFRINIMRYCRPTECSQPDSRLEGEEMLGWGM